MKENKRREEVDDVGKGGVCLGGRTRWRRTLVRPRAFSVIDNVDVDNVHERNPLNGECVAEDIDLDGSIAGYEITCYV